MAFHHPAFVATVADAIRTSEKTVLPRSTQTASALEGGAELLLSAALPDFGSNNDAPHWPTFPGKRALEAQGRETISS